MRRLIRRAIRRVRLERGRQPWAEIAVAPGTLALVAETCRLNDSDSAQRLLEFGCGTGRYLTGLREHENLEVFGVDSDTALLARAREQGLAVAAIGGSQARLPFADAAFDAVFSSNVIEHIPRTLYREYLAEIRRVLRPGGVFAVGAPNYPIKRLFDMGTAIRQPEYRWYYLLDDPTHVNRVSILGVERELARHFTQIRLEPSQIPFERTIPLLRRPRLRYRLRWAGNKFFGSCIRPEESR